MGKQEQMINHKSINQKYWKNVEKWLKVYVNYVNRGLKIIKNYRKFCKNLIKENKKEQTKDQKLWKNVGN